MFAWPCLISITWASRALIRLECTMNKNAKTRPLLLKSCLSGQSLLTRRLFEEAIETSVSTAPARRVVSTFAAHFLFATGILSNQKRER
jgi:hypothetical protein